MGDKVVNDDRLIQMSILIAFIQQWFDIKEIRLLIMTLSVLTKSEAGND